MTKLKRETGNNWAEESTLVIIVWNKQQVDGESITRILGVLTRLMKWFINIYKEEKKNKYDVKNQRRENLDVRGYQIHQVQWRWWQVWWVKREDQGNCKEQEKPQVLNKEVGYSQIRRFRWWCWYPEDIWRKHQGMGFLNNNDKWHTFLDGQAVQL